MVRPADRAATIEVLLQKPEEERWELAAGRLVSKEAASIKHGTAQAAAIQLLRGYRRRAGGPPSSPGGWWFATEVLVELGPDDVRRPDIAGWRRDRFEVLPEEVPIAVVPDWICEVVSRTNAANDTVVKMRLYQTAKVPHDWLIDPVAETLSVYRWTSDGYLHVLSAQKGSLRRPRAVAGWREANLRRRERGARASSRG